MMDYVFAKEFLSKGRCIRRKGWEPEFRCILLIKGDAVKDAIADRYGDEVLVDVSDVIYAHYNNMLIPYTPDHFDKTCKDWELLTTPTE